MLPGVSLSWTESAEPMATFLGYRVYKRELGEAAMVNIALITDRAQTSFMWYAVRSGAVYEFGVTVVAEVGAEEVESEMATVQSSVIFADSFLHDAGSPSHYAAFGVTAQTSPIDQELTLVQPAGLSTPVPHVGRRLTRNIRVTLAPEVNSNREVWDALAALVGRQYSDNTVLCYRDTLGTLLYCIVSNPQRSDTAALYGAQLDLREVNYREAI